MRLTVVERGRQIGEMTGEDGRIFMGMREVVQGLDHGVGLTVIEVYASGGQWFFLLSGRAPSRASPLPHLECIPLWELACLR